MTVHNTPEPLAALLASRRLLPLFVAQTLGALNDNLYKNAMVVLIVFKTASGGPVLVALAGGIFILPYLLFSSVAGTLADRADKSRLIRITKLLEIGLALLAAAGLLLGSIPLLFLVLFGLGAQSTFFSPLKYGILPDHLHENELVAGNGWIEAGTFGGILIGTIAGGALILAPYGSLIVSVAAVAVASVGAVAAFAVPPAPARAPDLPLSWNIPRQTATLLRQARANRPVWLAIVGLSWFWTLGATFLAEFPVLARDRFAGDPQVITLMLAMFAIGVGAGSVLTARLLRGEVSARYVPFAILLLSVFAGDFAWTTWQVGPATGWHTVGALLSDLQGWRMLLDLAGVALCGGAFSVPLYAIIQEWSDPALRSRMVAANNVLNAAFMVVGAVAIAAGQAAGMSAPAVLAVTAALNLVAAVITCLLLPQHLMRGVFRWYFRWFHQVRVEGLEHYPEPGRSAVIVPNHLSFLDGCLIAAYVPDQPSFAVHSTMAEAWWAQPFLAPVDVLAVDPQNPYAVRTMVRRVQEGRHLVVFPEGRITQTGGLMKIYEGAGMVADKTGAVVVPIRLDGLQFTPFSRMGGKLRRRLFPPVTLRILPPRRLHVPDGLAGRARRRAAAAALHDVMVDAAFEGAETGFSLFRALARAAGRNGAGQAVAEDIARKPLTYRGLLRGAAILARKLDAHAKPGARVGVLLPNANGSLVTFMALQAAGNTPAMLNFSAGAEAMLSACTTAGLELVVSSRAFIARGKLDRVVAQMERQVRFLWLEDLRERIGTGDKLQGLLDAWRPQRLRGFDADPDTQAAVLFTSGSEGAPKGVVLSHRNLLANCAQLAAVVDFNASDRVLNAMPMFHAFGLTGGTLLPVLHGVRVFFYPSPLHYRALPEIAYDSDATIAFGTDTFLTGWARFAHPYDFRAIRYIFAGAERVREETKRLYMERFGVRVLEGYGATETAPVIAMNTPMHNRFGTVGRVLPGIACSLDPVSGIEDGGRLRVRGPNVMLGYLRNTRPGVLKPPDGGWYDTGDIVSIDAEGFVTIRGRAKRFAKIAGEMVSMAAAEALAVRAWPDAQHAVVALPDERKGERLVLITTQPGAEPKALLAEARRSGAAELAVPRDVRMVPTMPLLGTGKVDYPAVQRLAGEPDIARPEQPTASPPPPSGPTPDSVAAQ